MTLHFENELVSLKESLLTMAGLAEKAVAYWLKAGRQAMAGSAMTEAVAILATLLQAVRWIKCFFFIALL